jgi:hypothetical protein
MVTGEYKFVVQAGKTFSDGKAHWPTMMILAMDRGEAMQIIADLSHQLVNPNQQHIQISIQGEQAKME